MKYENSLFGRVDLIFCTHTLIMALAPIFSGLLIYSFSSPPPFLFFSLPGMVWYAHHGNPVFQWEKSFDAPNYGGPGRPDPEALWEAVVKRKHALDHGNAVMPSHGTDLKMCSNDMDVTLSKCALM